MIQGNPEITTQRCITEASSILKTGKGLGELYTKIIAEYVPRIMSSRDGNLIVTQDRVSWMRHEGFELFKKSIKEFNMTLYNHIEKETGWRSDLDIKDMSHKYESWLTVERRTVDQDKDKFCSLLEVQKLRKDMESRWPKTADDKKDRKEKKGSGKSAGKIPQDEWVNWTKEQKDAYWAGKKIEADLKTIKSIEVKNGEKFIKKGPKGNIKELRVPCLFHASLKQSAEDCIRDTRHCYAHSKNIKEPWAGKGQPCAKCAKY
jgi:hypothetical protein